MENINNIITPEAQTESFKTPIISPPSKPNNYKFLIIIFLVIFLGAFSFFYYQKNKIKLTENEANLTEENKESIDPKTGTFPSEKDSYINQELGIILKHPDNWQLIKEDKNSSVWNVISDSKVVGTVILRKNNVLGDSTFFGSQQEVKSTINGLSGDKKIVLSGKSTTENFTFEKDINGESDKVVVEMYIPDQDAIGSQKSAELHENFDQVLRTISISNENKKPDLSKSKITISKNIIKSDGNDSAVLTINIRDSQNNPIISNYLDIIPDDPTDLNYNQIIAKSSLPSQRTDSAAAVLGNKIYVVGGKNYNDTLSISETYDPENNTWGGVSSLSSQRTELSLNTVNDKIYTIGGFNNSDFSDKVSVLNPPSYNDWSNKKSLPEGLKDHASEVVNGKIYTFAGMSKKVYPECGESSLGNITQVYDPVSDTWGVANDKVICGSGLVSATIGSKVYLFGGQISTIEYPNGQKTMSGAISSDLNIYDVSNNSWSKGPKLPHPRQRGGIGVINGKIYLIGGFKSWGAAPGEDYNQYVDVYNPQTNTWTTMGDFYPTPIDFSYVTYNNKIYTFGGEHFYSWPYRNAVFEFNPLKTSREIVVNPSNENGDVQFKFRSLFSGTRSYKIVTYDNQGNQIEIGKTSITFE